MKISKGRKGGEKSAGEMTINYSHLTCHFTLSYAALSARSGYGEKVHAWNLNEITVRMNFSRRIASSGLMRRSAPWTP